MAKKAEIIIRDSNNQEIDAFYSKTLTRRLNELPQGTEIKIGIKENNFAEQFVGDYVIKGLPNEPEEPHTCPVGQHWDDSLGKCIDDVVTHECPQGQHWDDAQQKCVDDIIVSTGTILYDSNTIGKWNDGTAKKVTDFDDRCPKPFVNGKGFEMHASGEPRLILDGHGVGTLEADSGHGRVYIDSVNYNAVTEYDLMFNDNIIDNHTCQTQSRHEEDGPPEHNDNGFGGVNYKIDRKEKLCGLKIEKYHEKEGENHIDGPEKKLPKDIELNQWVRVRLTTIPNEQEKTIYSKMEIDWNDGADFIKCIEHKYKNLEDYMVKKSDFENISYTWWRINNEETGSISIRNIVQTAL